LFPNKIYGAAYPVRFVQRVLRIHAEGSAAGFSRSDSVYLTKGSGDEWVIKGTIMRVILLVAEGI
jgi:hypothetical protein